MAISMSSKTASIPIFPSLFTYSGEEWTTVKLCGEGTFSKCFQIRNKNGRDLAVKVYKPCEKYEFAFQNEVEILSLLNAYSKSSLLSYIVNYIDALTVSGGKCILMELLGCNLKELVIKHDMKGFSNFLVKKILHDLLSAAMYLEEVGIVHGDIKPSNVLWNMNRECFQLIDFSVSFKSGLPSVGQPLQSLGYQAPEVLEWNKKIKGNSFSNEEDLDTSIDIWTIGCVLVYVITGQPLYQNDHAHQLPKICTNCELKCGSCVHSVRSNHLISSTRNELPVGDNNSLTYIISGFLQCFPDSRLRPSYILKHPFLVASQTPEAGITDLLLLPTRVLRFLNMYDETDPELIEDIILDIREECEKFGKVISVRTNKKNIDGYSVYIEYKYAEDCYKAQSSLTGRYFDNRFVVATFFPWQQFQENHFY